MKSTWRVVQNMEGMDDWRVVTSC